MRRTGLHCLLLVFLTALAYGQSWHTPFQYDDIHSIQRNPAIRKAGDIPLFFLNPGTISGLYPETSGFRPLLMATFALNYAWGGLAPFSYHLFNLLVHTLCTVCVYLLVWYLPREGEERGTSQLFAFWGALIFSLHPVQVESVTYISGRSSSLCALFFLFSFFAYMQYARQRTRLSLVFLSVFIYGLALLVKETAITLPVVLVLFELFFSHSSGRLRRFLAVLPHLLFTFIYLGIRFYLLRGIPHPTHPLRPLREQVVTQFPAWVHNISILLFPVNLSVDYDFHVFHSFFDGPVLFSFFMLSFAGILVWRISSKHPAVAFFALWFAVTLLPTSSIIPLEDVVADRWLYLPSVGYAGALAAAASWAFHSRIRSARRSWKLVFFFLCFLTIEMYGFATVLRNFAWTSKLTLWTDAATKSPNKARPHTNLCLALNNAGRLEEAVWECRRAIELNPEGGEAYLNLGEVYMQQGKISEAILAYRRAIVLNPRLGPEGHNNLGVAYFRLGRLEEAIWELRQAVAARPLEAAPYYNLGNIYEQKDEIDGAISCLEKVVQIEPKSYAAPYQDLSRLYDKKGWKEKSREAYQKFLRYANRPPSPWGP